MEPVPLDIKLSDIIEDDRFRKDMGDLEGLGGSIKKHGMIQRVVVKREGDKYKLLAGGRRRATAVKAGRETIRAEVYPEELSALQARYIELIENVDRKAFAWHEEAALREEIHRMEQKLNPGKTQTLANTAETLGVSVGQLSDDIALAKAIEVIPQLKDAPSKKDAKKQLAKLQEEVLVKQMAHRVQAANSGKGIDRVRQELSYAYIVGDFFENIKKVPDGSIDFVDLDPPYAIEYDTNRADNSTGTEHFVEWKNEDYLEFLRKTVAECVRVMKANSWLVCWHSIWRLPETKAILQSFPSLDVIGGPLLWIKPGKVARNHVPHKTLSLDYEPALYARKGEAVLTRQGASSIFTFAPCRDNIHPTEKPVELLKEVFSVFTTPGQRVLSPFLGSGNTIIAAYEKQLQPIGFDLSQHYKDSFILRLQNWVPLIKEKEDAGTKQ